MFELTQIVAADDLDAVRTFIYAWRQTWQSKDIDHFASFYAPDFRKGGFDYQGFLTKKKRLFRKPGAISIDISYLEISAEGNRAIARFVQRFKSPYFSDVGGKILILTKSHLSWKIASETWQPLAGFARTTKFKTVTSDTPTRNSGNETQEAHKGGGGEGIIVKRIKFETEKEGTEKVLVNLSRFYIPTLLALEGSNPRIIIDISDVSSWNGHSKIPVNGKIIKQIRIHLHRDSESVFLR